MTNTDREPVAWRMVPVEPTEAMMQVGYKAYGATMYETQVPGWGNAAISIYAAMIAAAPPPTAPTVEEVAQIIVDMTGAGTLGLSNEASRLAAEPIAARIIELLQRKA